MQVTLEAAHKGARKIEAQPGRLGLYLEGVEEPLRVGNPAAGIAKANGHA